MATINFSAAQQKPDPPAPRKSVDVPQTTIEQLLANTKVSTLPVTKGKVIVIDSNTTPGEAFQTLMDNNILGAPVYDSTHHKYTGFLDVRDLVDLVVHRYDQSHAPAFSPPISTHTLNAAGPAAGAAVASTATAAPSSPHLNPHSQLHVDSNILSGAHLHTAKPQSSHPAAAAAGVGAGPVSAAAAASHAAAASASAKQKDAYNVSAYIQELLLTGEVMIGAKMTVSYLSRRHPFRPVSTDATLLDVAKALASEAHRVPVVDAATQRVVNIISQSSIVAFLNAHTNAFRAEASRTVADWKLGVSPVLSVRDNARTIDAFRVMSEKHMSGLAVVDAAGVFVANTASTDLKLYLAHSSLGNALLNEPVLDFLSQLRQEDLKNDTRTKVPTLSVQSTAPLSLVIGRLAATKSHKIFVANPTKQYRPEAVISLTDVLRAVCKLAKPPAPTASPTPGNSAAPDASPGPSHGKLGADKKN